MALDPVTNFGYSNVATAPDPATTGTSLVVDAGEGVRFPTTGDGDFNVVVWSAGVQPNSSNAEIAFCASEALPAESSCIANNVRHQMCYHNPF